MNLYKRYIFYFFLALAGCLNSQTPSFNYHKLGSEDGLNNANIFNIEQNADGLLYITTQNGIYTYDGYTFVRLPFDSLKSNSLLNTKIAPNNKLFLSVRGEGIFNADRKTKNYSRLPALSFNNNADDYIINENFAYLLTSGIKLLTINLANKTLINDKVTANNESNRAFCLLKTKSGKILVGRTDGLYEAFAGEQKKLPLLAGYSVHSITEKSNGDIVVGTTSKIFVFRGEKMIDQIVPTYNNKSYTFQFGGEKSIDHLVADDHGRIWFSSYPDENLYLIQDRSCYDVFEILDISPTLINCIYKDAEQNIWIGTFNDGIYFIQNPFFNSINFSFNGNNLNINQVYLKNNLLVAATGNGLYGLNLNSNKAKTLSKPDKVLVDPINSISELNGTLYYAKNSQFNLSPTIFFDSKTTYKIKPVVAKLFYPINNNQSIVVDFQADILLTNSEGTKILDTLISFPDYRIAVNDLFKVKDTLYVATNNGLFIYSFETKKQKAMLRPELSYNINDLAIINQKLYAAHEAGITDIYARKLIQQAGKLRLNGVKKIIQLGDQIWLATLDGVFICDINLNPIKILNKSNGLLSNAINDITFNDQTVSIATARGIAITDRQTIDQYNSKRKPVTIDYIDCNGEQLLLTEQALTLNANQDDITIYFLSAVFNRPNKQFFRYKLDNSEWKLLDGLSLNVQLAGGNHRIEISASTDNIVWSDSNGINIEKEEKFSEKKELNWLITLGVILLGTIISFVWVRRVKRKSKKQLAEAQQVNLLKHQAMNSLLSPHFIFNSLTSIQNYINTNDSLKASEYLAKFSRLIRMIIEKATQSNISIHDELSRLTYYLELEKERFKNKFDYLIEIDPAINTREVFIPNMIIQPHVENCIIHGILPKQTHGTLTISFTKQEPDVILIKIEDDGIGLIKAKEHVKTGHKSLGTSTIQNILEINSKLTGKKQKVSMTDKSTIDPNLHGTIITIELEL